MPCIVAANTPLDHAQTRTSAANESDLRAWHPQPQVLRSPQELKEPASNSDFERSEQRDRPVSTRDPK